MLATHTKSFFRCERGAALVELAVALPLMLVFFAAIVEGARIMWSYQASIAGVRDASRYLARIVPGNVCSLNGGDVSTWTTNSYVSGWETDLTQVVSQSVLGQSMFPADVSLTTPVIAEYICDDGAFRNAPVAIGRVSAEIKIRLPFSSLLTFLGGTNVGTIDATLRDQSRIYGS